MDKDMDKAIKTNGLAPPGISVQNGLGGEDAMDIDEPVTNGASKRKSRNSVSKVTYAEKSEESDDDDDDAPLV